MTREELIQECRCDCMPNCQHPKWDEVEPLVDFILSRERLLLQKIGKPLMAWKNRDTTEGKRWGGEIPEIDEALSIIEKEGMA